MDPLTHTATIPRLSWRDVWLGIEAPTVCRSPRAPRLRVKSQVPERTNQPNPQNSAISLLSRVNSAINRGFTNSFSRPTRTSRSTCASTRPWR
jgi:hypothetical protein